MKIVWLTGRDAIATTELIERARAEVVDNAEVTGGPLAARPVD